MKLTLLLTVVMEIEDVTIAIEVTRFVLDKVRRSIFSERETRGVIRYLKTRIKKM